MALYGYGPSYGPVELRLKMLVLQVPSVMISFGDHSYTGHDYVGHDYMGLA